MYQHYTAYLDNVLVSINVVIEFKIYTEYSLYIGLDNENILKEFRETPS